MSVGESSLARRTEFVGESSLARRIKFVGESSLAQHTGSVGASNLFGLCSVTSEISTSPSPTGNECKELNTIRVSW